ncbi:hypothetical protein E9232_002782 [Inquilinus ginsengisoli]|uniref:Uncharacterized protein n=1 Tax=Inquilinus ginsengisoli TaxID=363840 RepID=A0ABU1JNS2_9PROT|nr:hypothetical protein [Inquilinus ginsengisoli]MDR6290261.1 hypothetical protein [Inquilinus ginsengisoli]
MVGPVTRQPPPPWRTLRRDAPSFEQSLALARQQAPAQPAQAPAAPTDAPPALGPFPPGAKPLGINEHKVGEAWPFRIFIRDEGFDFTDNDALHAQLPATPKLDPLPFGNRPAAAPGADRRLQADDTVIVLDETRLGYLGQQRQLLAKASDPKISDYERQLTKDDLAAVVAQEIDYAATEQSAPDFDALIQPIAARAPDDPVFQEAIRTAKAQKLNEWKVDDRTADGAAAVQKLGADGKYDDVTALVRQRVIAAADSTAKDTPEPQALVAAMTHLTGVYKTYAGGDTAQYLAAVQKGFSEAHQEVFLERPIREIEAAWGKGGKDGAKAAAAKLAELTDTNRTMPILGGQVMSDPRVSAIARGCVDEVAKWRPGPDLKDAKKVISDLAQASQNVVCGDGDAPGQGKAAVDALAGHMVDKLRSEEVTGDHLNPLNMMNLPELLAHAGEEGNVTLSLAMTVRLDQLAGQEKSPRISDNNPAPMRDAILWAATKGLENFSGTVKAHEEKTLKDGDFIGVPLQTWGSTLSPEDQAAAIQKLLADHPDKANTLEQDGQRTTWLNERSDSITRALALYGGTLKHVEGFETGKIKNYTVPGPMLPPTDAQTLLAAAPREPKHTNPTWFLRSNRLLLTFGLQEQLKRSMPPGDYKNLLAGKTDQLSARGQQLLKGSNVLGRFSAATSSYLFARNAAECLSGALNSTAFVDKLVDAVYVPVHASMSLSAAANAGISPELRKQIFGTDATGRPNTPLNKAYNAAAGRIDHMAASATTKGLLKGIAGAILRDTGDAYYVFADTVNVFGYMGKPNTGWVHSVGYAFSVAGDLAFLSAPGFQIVGAESTAAVAAGGAGAEGLLGFLATRGVAFWTGVGAALMVIASGINYFASLADKAHEFDGADADFLKALGVRGDVADKLGLHTLATTSDQGSAGPILMAAFWNLGYTAKDMAAVMNSWTPDQADKIATYIKYYKRHTAENVTQAVLDWAPKNGIPMPRYGDADVGQFKAMGVRDEIAKELGTTAWPTPDPKRVTAGQVLQQGFSYLGYSQAEMAQVMNSWSPEQAGRVADFAKSYRTDSGGKLAEGFVDFARQNGLPLPQYDGADARRLTAMGVRRDIAGLVTASVTQGESEGDTNPVTALTATFTKLGYSQADMAAVVNSWTPEQAGGVADSLNQLAVQAKAGTPPKDIPGELVRSLQSRMVTVPAYDDANIRALTAAGVKRETALLVARDPANTPKRAPGSPPAILKALEALGNSREQAIAVMNAWTPRQANTVATLLDQTSINAPVQDIPKQQLLDLEQYEQVPLHPK